jgi:hypothetical protein
MDKIRLLKPIKFGAFMLLYVVVIHPVKSIEMLEVQDVTRIIILLRKLQECDFLSYRSALQYSANTVYFTP